MTRLLNIGHSVWNVATYVLAALICILLITRGIHPFWVFLLLLYRKTVFRIAVLLYALYLLTSQIM